MTRLETRKQGNVEGSALCDFQDSVIKSIDFPILSGEPHVQVEVLWSDSNIVGGIPEQPVGDSQMERPQVYTHRQSWFSHSPELTALANQNQKN